MPAERLWQWERRVLPVFEEVMDGEMPLFFNPEGREGILGREEKKEEEGRHPQACPVTQSAQEDLADGGAAAWGSLALSSVPVPTLSVLIHR